MMELGLLEEARSVYPLRHLNALNTVGYKELFAYFDGTMDLPTAVARIGKNTRVYAKKQLTWMQRDTTIQYLPDDDRLASASKAIEQNIRL
jgi:tRNA dimethylallyltransferase